MASGDSIERILANMRAHGLEPDRLRHVFLTHYHIDHMGGLASWQDRYQLVASIGAEAVDAVESGDTEQTGFALAQAKGLYPAHYEFRPARIADPLTGGETRRVGLAEIEFIPTPGHCRGHGTYRLRGSSATALFTGDCVFHGGRISLLNTADTDLAAYRDSILRLAELEFDALLPGHGALCVRDGEDHVALAAAAFRELSLPPNHS
jgi:glyoxylase-like metal-dependent hydrolase (beta-lactamase superfamily II)